MDKNGSECCICLNSDDVTLVMMRCHLSHVVCVQCYNKITKCPLCRTGIKEEDEIVNICEILDSSSNANLYSLDTLLYKFS